jgi:hypothetical protein
MIAVNGSQNDDLPAPSLPEAIRAKAAASTILLKQLQNE